MAFSPAHPSWAQRKSAKQSPAPTQLAINYLTEMSSILAHSAADPFGTAHFRASATVAGVITGG